MVNYEERRILVIAGAANMKFSKYRRQMYTYMNKKLIT